MEKVTAALAKHLRDLYFGGNWTSVNLKESLDGVTWQQATTKVYNLNTIATLVYHTSYYINAVTKVLQGEPLQAKDAYSFDLPPINNSEDWELLQQHTWSSVETFANLIEQFPVDKLWETFVDEKYGNYYRNLQGIIEHTHYHLGQIVLIKKILQQSADNEKGIII